TRGGAWGTRLESRRRSRVEGMLEATGREVNPSTCRETNKRSSTGREVVAGGVRESANKRFSVPRKRRANSDNPGRLSGRGARASRSSSSIASGRTVSRGSSRGRPILAWAIKAVVSGPSKGAEPVINQNNDAAKA